MKEISNIFLVMKTKFIIPIYQKMEVFDQWQKSQMNSPRRFYQPKWRSKHPQQQYTRCYGLELLILEGLTSFDVFVIKFYNFY